MEAYVSLASLQSFLFYMATALVLTVVYVVVYIWVTPHPEFRLIRENNLAASVAFGGSLIGFAVPLASVIANSAALVDCVIWGVIAIVIQIVIFYLVRNPSLKFRMASRRAKRATVCGWVRLHWQAASSKLPA